MGTIREGRWDCTTCGTRGIRGGEEKCPNCAADKPADVHYYLPGNEPPVTDPVKLSDARAGPDWVCEHCGTHNRAYRNNCKDCGAAKGSSPSKTPTDYAMNNVPRTGDIAPEEGYSPRQSRRRVQTSHQDKPPPPARSFSGINLPWSSELPSWLGPALVMALAVAIIAGIGFLVFHTEERTLTVSGFSWERSIAVEQYRTVTKSDWSVPAGGRMLSSRREIRSYVTVLDHYETKSRQVSRQVSDGTETYVCGHRDLRNGYFEDITCTRTKYRTEWYTETYQEPVYHKDPVWDTKYTYEIEKWVYDRTEKSFGQDHEAYWLQFTLRGNERETSRSEKYVIFFVDEKEKQYSFGTDYSRWMTFRVGEVYIGSINRLDQILELKSK